MFIPVVNNNEHLILTVTNPIFSKHSQSTSMMIVLLSDIIFEQSTGNYKKEKNIVENLFI